MCGICGIVDPGAEIGREIIERMTGTLRHRGPDDEAYYLPEPPPDGPAVGLGFRRLSIIDVDGGRQPLSNEDGSVWIVLNGEIYNFRELRERLTEDGHVFRTGSDAEVVVHLYEESGIDCLTQVNGMFAFALWDADRRLLLAARDRMGEKPLYYAEKDGRLLFGSELKALLAHPACPSELDPVSLERYLAFEYVPTPRSIMAGVRKLPAGHRLVWARGRTSVESYWEIPAGVDLDRRADEEVVEEFRARLSEAVRLRLVSDVPLGAFLSGGVDSSSVVAFMCEHLPPEQVETFSIGFTERSFDESGHARRVAHHFGTDHREEVFTADTLLDILPEVAAGLDEPFADPSVLPTFLLSRFARRSVTVALGGDGSDEVLAGYPTFAAEAVARRYPLPRGVHERFVVPLVNRLPVSTDNFSLDFKLKRFLRGAVESPAVRHQFWLGAFTPAEQQALLRRSVGGDPYAEVRALYGSRSRQDWLERLIYLYARTYLQDDILVKVDRASMLTSLEVRAPFLDHTLVEFLARVRPGLKLQRLTTKALLRRAVASSLPAGIADRKKKGFGIPVAEWFKSRLREPLLDLLSAERLRRQGLFDEREVSRLIAEHLAGTRDHRKQLWTLFVFQLWHQSYMEAASEHVPVARPSAA